MLNGQKLQGPPTAAEVNFMLKAKNMEDRYVKSHFNWLIQMQQSFLLVNTNVTAILIG